MFQAALPAILALATSALASCGSGDLACAGRNAATEIVTSERYRIMSADERRSAAARFDALARRCGWEP